MSEKYKGNQRSVKKHLLGTFKTFKNHVSLLFEGFS